MPTLPPLPVTVNWMGIIGKTALYVSYFLIALAILAGLWFIWQAFKYKISVKYWELYGSSKNGTFSVGSLKSNRFKWDKKNTVWRPLWPLFNRIDVKPFDPEYIHPGNRVYAFKLGQVFMPGRLNTHFQQLHERVGLYAKIGTANPGFEFVSVDDIDFSGYVPLRIGGGLSEASVRGSLDPMPTHWDKWLQSQIHENTIEFATENWWDQNKHLVMIITVSAICCVMVVGSAWLIYKMMVMGRPEASQLTSALKGFASSVGGNTGGPAG